MRNLNLSNLGSGGEISVRYLLEVICSLTELYHGTVSMGRDQTGWPAAQVPLSGRPTLRALAEFGWRAKTPLRDGLRKTIAWYEEEVRSESPNERVVESSGKNPLFGWLVS